MSGRGGPFCRARERAAAATGMGARVATGRRASRPPFAFHRASQRYHAASHCRLLREIKAPEGGIYRSRNPFFPWLLALHACMQIAESGVAWLAGLDISCHAACASLHVRAWISVLVRTVHMIIGHIL